MSLFSPHQQRRRDDQAAERVAHPPEPPESRQRTDRLHAAGAERRGADARRDDRREGDRTEEDEDVADAREAGVEVEAAKERDGEDRLEGVPMAMPVATASGSSAVAFAISAPRKTPAALRRPRRRRAAMANPVGGQTAVTWCVLIASARPSFAKATYNAATPRTVRRSTKDDFLMALSLRY